MKTYYKGPIKSFGNGEWIYKHDPEKPYWVMDFTGQKREEIGWFFWDAEYNRWYPVSGVDRNDLVSIDEAEAMLEIL